MSKHTPGPWFVYEDCSRVGAEGAKNVETGIAGKYLTESLFDRSGNLYNPRDAHIIAAAPDLLAALRALVDEYEPNLKAFSTDAPRKAKWQAALAAIAAATGEPS